MTPEQIEVLNIPERRKLEMSKVHVCRHCLKEFTGWVMDNRTNTYLTCHCPHCEKLNIYSYWP